MTDLTKLRSEITQGPWRVKSGTSAPAGPETGHSIIGGCGCCDSPWINGDGKECDANATAISLVPRLLDDVIALRAFAQAVMSGWPDCGALDGFELQGLAEKHGLLAPTTKHAPCGEGCNCQWYAAPTDKDWQEGVTCYHRTTILTGE